MNTDVLVFTSGDASGRGAERVRDVFEAVEGRFSRFLPASELSQLNASGRGRVTISSEMAALLTECMHYYRITGGVFDPSLLRALEAAGYHQSFERIRADSEVPAEALARERTCFARVRLHSGKAAEVDMPPGMALDFGGIAKGFAVDQAAKALPDVPAFLIDAGGDILARGSGPGGDGWLVSVASPFDDEAEVDRIRLRNEAVATSTTARRRWRRAGRWLHHIIDPATGKPAAGDIVAVTVRAPTATEADVFAKTALLMGVRRGRAFLEKQRAHGLFILTNGSVVASEGWLGGGV
jgi:thiamine biosynthesis lipoprotein